MLILEKGKKVRKDSKDGLFLAALNDFIRQFVQTNPEEVIK